MAQTASVAISGTVLTSVRVNIRNGAPSLSAPVGQKLDPQTPVSFTSIAAGDAVEGNPLWFGTKEGDFVWAGGCGSPQLDAAAQPVAPSRYPGLLRTPLVVDLSHGDEVQSFQAAKDAGLLGVIHKATTGGTGQDDAYPARREKALAANLLWGAYHWGTAAPIDAQVANFLGWTKIDQRDTTTLIALDFETTVGDQMTLQGARDFCTELFNRLGRRPVIYGGQWLKASLGSTQDPFFALHRLWLAQYGPDPCVQASWTDFWLWQYTDGASGPLSVKTVPGLPGDSLGRLDCDYFNGDEAALRAAWAA